MSLENPLAYCLLMLILLGTSQVFVSRSRFFHDLATVHGGRFGALDGFRGLLASGVFVHHAVVNYGYAQTGRWEKPAARLYESLGGQCVLYFFMITGLLFWSKCLRAGGHIDARDLVSSRIRRIMPAYIASVVLVFAAVAIESSFRLHTSPLQLLFTLVRWLLGGLAGSPDINGISPVTINGAVTWTLQYEWVFYLSLPLLAWFATQRRFPFLIALFCGLAAAARYFGVGVSMGLIARFLVGMAIAHLVILKPSIPFVSSSFGSIVVVGCLVVAAAFPVPSAVSALLNTVAFAGIVYGNDLFGLLRTRAALFLGHVSYSVYLLHCIILYAAIKLLPVPLAALSATEFWLFCGPVAVAVVIAGALSYRLFEHPFVTVRAPHKESSSALSRARS